MMNLQKIQNPAINNIFATVTIETEAKREQSQSVFGTYPYGSGMCNINETFSKSIADYTDNQKLRLKTIVAHMCEIGNAIATNYESIDLCHQTINHFKTSKEIYNEESRRQFCSLQERSIDLFKSLNKPLHTTMSILIALLIKDTYCMDQETRLLIINFFVKAHIILVLDRVALLNIDLGPKVSLLNRSPKVLLFNTDLGPEILLLNQNRGSNIGLSNTHLGFSFIFNDNKRLSTAGLSNTFISANLDEGCDENGIMIPIFAFNSDELKAKNLPSELEADWPFSV